MLAWANAMMLDWFPKGPLRVDVRSTHIVLGAVLACVVATRLVWRTTRGRRLPAAEAGMLCVAAKASHWGLYALLVATLALGAFDAWVRGKSLFRLFGIPMFDAGNEALRSQGTGAARACPLGCC